MKLPATNGLEEDNEFEDDDGSVSRMGSPFSLRNFHLTKAAIAGVVGEMARNFEPGKSYCVTQRDCSR